MQISQKDITLSCPENEIYNKLLSIDGKKILELGCGNAATTRAIAENGHDRHITAMEVDEVQHKKNLLLDDLPNVDFKLGGAENIPASDESFDIVFMFKSLHHVPVNMMDQALREVKRVLKPGGRAYISEPIFDGDFNEVLRLFHDEEEVRKGAFMSLEKAVREGLFVLADEIFFNIPLLFKNFAEFENRFITVSHTSHHLSDELYKRVKDRFSLNMQTDGARFLLPIRVDILQKALVTNEQ